MFDQRRVSQERVIGISFVDILIQAVFVLLIALIVGYVDPVVKIQMEQASEYGQIGKDLCHKLDKDSLQACREHIEGKSVEVDSKFSGIGKDFCRSIGAKSSEECRQRADKELARLRPCLKPVNDFQLSNSLTFVLKGPSEIEFQGFSSAFLERLKERNDQDRLQKVKGIALGSSFEPSRISAVFDFIREKDCFHQVGFSRPGKYSDNDLRAGLSALVQLRRPAD